MLNEERRHHGWIFSQAALVFLTIPCLSSLMTCKLLLCFVMLAVAFGLIVYVFRLSQSTSKQYLTTTW